MTDEWNRSREFQQINKLVEERQLEIDFLTALKEARPFIERLQEKYEMRDYDGCIRIAELYGVPFNDRWDIVSNGIDEPGEQRRYFPSKFFEKYNEFQRDRLIVLLEEQLNWPEFWRVPTEAGWVESRNCG